MEKEIKTALLVVDFQNEFLNGKIPLPYSSSIIEKINKNQSKFDIVCFSKNVFPKMDKVKDKIVISDTGNYCNVLTDINLKLLDDCIVKSFENRANYRKCKPMNFYKVMELPISLG